MHSLLLGSAYQPSQDVGDIDVGLSQGMISLVEHEQRNPSLDTMLRMAHALKIELSDVLDEAESLAKKGR